MNSEKGHPPGKGHCQKRLEEEWGSPLGDSNEQQRFKIGQNKNCERGMSRSQRGKGEGGGSWWLPSKARLRNSGEMSPNNFKHQKIPQP